MSNHIHVVATDIYGERPRFMELLDAELAKAASSLIGRWGGFWEPGRSYSAVELLDEDSVVDKLAYTLANPVSSFLVRRARRWPGSTSASVRFDDVVDAPRPDIPYYANSCQPPSYSFRLEVPRGLDELECHQRVWARVRAIEKQAEVELRTSNRKFIGAKRVLRQDPYDSPSSWEKRRGLNPTFASRDKWARIEATQRNRNWLSAYIKAFDAWRGGNRDAVFPTGTWLMARRYACACVPAPG